MRQQPVQDARLAEAVNRLVEELHPRAIILFGSRARGTNRAESDYDLLVVSEQLRDYDEVYRPAAGRGLRCDVVPCTLDAWREAHLDAGVACFETRSTRDSCCTANPRRVDALLQMADEDLVGAKALLAREIATVATFIQDVRSAVRRSSG
jgi:hypothetical protein